MSSKAPCRQPLAGHQFVFTRPATHCDILSKASRPLYRDLATVLLQAFRTPAQCCYLIGRLPGARYLEARNGVLSRRRMTRVRRSVASLVQLATD